MSEKTIEVFNTPSFPWMMRKGEIADKRKFNFKRFIRVEFSTIIKGDRFKAIWLGSNDFRKSGSGEAGRSVR